MYGFPPLEELVLLEELAPLDELPLLDAPLDELALVDALPLLDAPLLLEALLETEPLAPLEALTVVAPLALLPLVARLPPAFVPVVAGAPPRPPSPPGACWPSPQLATKIAAPTKAEDAMRYRTADESMGMSLRDQTPQWLCPPLRPPI